MAEGGPVLLALSTFRQSEAAVERAFAAAAEASAPLILLVVVDQNLARYFIGTDALPGSTLREDCEAEMLARHQRENRAAAERLAAQAAARGLSCRVLVPVGRFAIEVLRVCAEAGPRLVVTTRSRRPAWVRRFFGSPVDEVVARAGCPVTVV